MDAPKAHVVGLAGALLVALGAVATARVIYSEDFSGSGAAALNGTAPDVRPGGQTWTAGPLWFADGTKVTNGSSHAFLPLSPQAGYLYTLSLDVNPDISGSDDWFALGFSQDNATVNNAFHDGTNRAVGWMLNRENDASTSVIQMFRGPSTGNGSSYNLNPDKVGWVNLKVVLDTQPVTTSSWTVQWFADGVPLRGPEALNSTPMITHVGLGGYSTATGAVGNFLLTNDFPSTPSSFLLRHLPMDDNAANTTVLNRVSAPQSTYVGANTDARHSPGLIGSGALSLNGTSDFIRIDDEADLNFAANGAFTMLGWVKTLDANGMLVSFRDQTSGNPLIELGVWAGAARAEIRDSGGGGLRQFGGGAAINDDAWHQIAMRRRVDGYIELYRDGILVATSSGTCTGAITTSGLRDIGSEQRWVVFNETNRSADERYLAALVDDIGIWAAALSPQEIALAHGLGLFAGDDLESPDLAAMLAAYNVQGLVTLSNYQLWGYVTDLTGVAGTVGGSILTNDASIVLSGTLLDGMQFIAVVPEPATLTLLALGALGLLRRRRATV